MSKGAVLGLVALGAAAFLANEKRVHQPGRDTSAHDAFFDVGLLPYVLGLGGMFAVAAFGVTPVAVGVIALDQLVLKRLRSPARKRLLAERWGRILG